MEAKLGPLPNDLAEVLADMAIASPAVVALRCCESTICRHHSVIAAILPSNLANEFFSLFNKPESIAAVRLSTERSSLLATCSAILR